MSTKIAVKNMDKQDQKKLEELSKTISKLENYIKVIGYEDYKRINKYIEKSRYSSIDYLNKNTALKEQLEYDFRMMLRAMIKDDFLEFCRYANLQIELMVDEFIKVVDSSDQNITVTRNQWGAIDKIEINDRTEGSSKSYKGTNLEKLEFCIDLANITKENMKNSIKKIMKLRNIASHRDALGDDVESRIKKIPN